MFECIGSVFTFVIIFVFEKKTSQQVLLSFHCCLHENTNSYDILFIHLVKRNCFCSYICMIFHRLDIFFVSNTVDSVYLESPYMHQLFSTIYG